MLRIFFAKNVVNKLRSGSSERKIIKLKKIQ